MTVKWRHRRRKRRRSLESLSCSKPNNLQPKIRCFFFPGGAFERMVFSSQKIRTRLKILSGLLQPPWPHKEIWLEHVP